MSTIISALLLSLLATLAWSQDDANPHKKAATCIYQFSSGCDIICLVCHPPGELTPSDQVITDVADIEDDIILCLDCHSTHAGPNNHAVGVEYNTLLTKLVSAPDGVKLKCAKTGSPCKLQCSTCHNPHSSEVNLLRINNQGSALCIACHRK